MLILLSLTLYVFFLGFINPQEKLTEKNKRNYLIAAGIMIALVAGLRAEDVGTRDTSVYCSLFEGLSARNSFVPYYKAYLSDNSFLLSESGFYFFVWLLTRVSSNSQMLIFASSAFVTFATCVFIYKNSEDVSLSLLMYLALGSFTFNLNGMRQALAMSICLLSYEFVKKRRIVPFTITILIAMLFHKTAFVFAFVYFLPMLKKGKHLFLYISGIAGFSVASTRLIELYDSMSGEDYAMASTVESGGLFAILIYVFVILIALMVYKKMDNINTKSAFYGTLTGFVLFVSRYALNEMTERLSWYFFYFIILLLPNVLVNFEKKERRMIRLLFGVFAVLLFAYRIYNGQLRYFHFCF